MPRSCGSSKTRPPAGHRGGQERRGAAACSRRRLVTFSTTDPEADWFSDGHLVIRRGDTLLDMEQDTALRGLHNAENAMAAMAACDALGISAATMREALAWLRAAAAPLRTDPHARRRGIPQRFQGHQPACPGKRAAFANAARRADRRRQGQGPRLLAGRSRCCARRRSRRSPSARSPARSPACSRRPCPANRSPPWRMPSPWRAVSPRADPPSCCLPGTSSFDQFTGYEQRGNTFRDLVHQLH